MGADPGAGDWGTSPTNRSTLRWFWMRSVPGQRAKVTSEREEPLLWNLMRPVAGAPDRSFSLDNQPDTLDQDLVDKNTANRQP